METRGIVAIASAGALCALVLFGAHFARLALDGSASLEGAEAAREPAAEPLLEVATAGALPATLPPHAFSAADRAFLAQLRQDHGTALDTPRAQVRLVEQLTAYVRAHHPAGGEALAAAFLRELAPRHAGVLILRLQQLARYAEWLEGQRDALREMAAEQRRAALRQARQEIFGPEADAIWVASHGGRG